MEESIDIPDPDEIQDLGSARVLLKLVLKTAEHQTQTIARLTETIEALTQKISELERALFGKKSERVVPVGREITSGRSDATAPRSWWSSILLPTCASSVACRSKTPLSSPTKSAKNTNTSRQGRAS